MAEPDALDDPGELPSDPEAGAGESAGVGFGSVPEQAAVASRPTAKSPFRRRLIRLLPSMTVPARA